MSKLHIFLIVCLYCFCGFINAKTTVDDITTYNGQEEFVYAAKQQSWYALNNNGIYELWGIVENATNLNQTTHYSGKYVRVGTSIYCYSGDSWQLTQITVTPIQTPENGIYIFDADGNFTLPNDWDTSNNHKALGVAYISDNVKFVVSINYVMGLLHLTYRGSVNGVFSTNSFSEASNDFGGKENTHYLVEGAGSDAQQAYYCTNYTFKNGEKGYEPALGEILLVFNQNKDAFNEAIALLADWYVGWTGFEGPVGHGAWFASSTEHGNGCFWRISRDGLYEGSGGTAYDYTNDPYKNYITVPFGVIPEYTFNYPYDSEPSDTPEPPADDPIVTTYNVNGVSFNMIDVEGGTFTMGATAEQGDDYCSDELPTHQVTLSRFSIGQTEVTQELWQAVMGNNPSAHNYGGSYPVENVSWNDCQEFIAKLNQMTGENFRLPTEAEWEFAARGGNKTNGYKYPGSNNVNDVAWYNCGTLHVVAKKAANELGLFDMAGNVEEYCYDWYAPYSADAQINPKGPSTGSIHVDRGSSFYSMAIDCRVSRRDNGVSPTGHISDSDPDLGLRLAMSGMHIFGDVDCDGHVTAADITALYNYLLYGDTLYIDTLDVNSSGSINAADITEIYTILLGSK